MATIAPPAPKPDKGAGRRQKAGGRGPDDPTGPPGGGQGGPGGDPLSMDRRYYTGMWVGLAAVVMLFTAFTSAYVVRRGIAEDWQATALPPLIWVNTLVLLASSVTLEAARRRYPRIRRFQPWWLGTIALGGLFLAGQLAVWGQLANQGVYVDTNPASSFFYLLTAAHGVHLAGGLGALIWLTWRLWRGALTRVTVDVTSLYWHFMDGLWVYLMLLLLIWR